MFIYSIKKFGFLLLAAVLITGLAIGCNGDDNGTDYESPDNGNGGNGDTPGNLVVMENIAFSPSTITISVGDTVTWRNDDDVAHTVTSDTGDELNSGNLSPGETYQNVFNQAGDYPYHCTIHPVMTGTVIVE